MDTTTTTLASNQQVAEAGLTGFLDDASLTDAYQLAVDALPGRSIRECAERATGANRYGELAKKFSAEAYRECGKKLLAIPPATGKRDVTSRLQAANDAGMTERERKTALSIAGLPEDIFLKIVEAPDLSIKKLLDAANALNRLTSRETPRPATKKEPKAPDPMAPLLRAWNGADKKTRDGFFKMMSISRSADREPAPTPTAPAAPTASPGELHEATRGFKAMIKKGAAEPDIERSRKRRAVAFAHFKLLLANSNLPALMGMSPDEIIQLVRTI